MANILENTVEQSKKASLHQVQLSLITERERKEEIFKMVFAFEDFVRRYGQYHLNESVSQLNIANNKLGKWKYFNLNYSNPGKKMQYYIIAIFSDNGNIQTFISTILKFLVILAICQS